jgi:nucleoside-diphosphate-sugar epimerase
VLSRLTADARILITGGSGFIGTNLVAYLRGRGHAVRNLDIAEPRNASHRDVWKQVDLLDAATLTRLATDFAPTHLVHLAARTDLGGKTVADYSANTAGTKNVTDLVRRLAGLQRIVYASTRLVCRIGYQPKNDTDYCPPNAYGESKVEAEKIVRAADGSVPWTLVRPTSIWGPWFGVPYRTFFDTIRKGHYFHPGQLNPAKSFGFVGNTVFQLEALLAAPEADIHRQTFYLCDYPPLRLREWSELIRQALNARAIPTVPLPLLRTLARCGDVATMFHLSPPLTSFRLNNLVTDMVHDSAQLKALCGDLPYSLEDGVLKTVEWMDSEGRHA